MSKKEKAEEMETPEKSAQQKAAVDNPEPHNRGLFEFLVDVFESGFPQKICVATAFGPGGKRTGPIVRELPFKPGREKPNVEDLVVMSNDFMRIAQDDCNDLDDGPQSYAVMAYDLARSPGPYARKVLRLYPAGNHQEKAILRGDDLDDQTLSNKLLLGLLESERRDKRWLMEQFGHMVSGVLERDAARIEALEESKDHDHERQMKLVQATEQMLNQAEDRRSRAERAQIWNDAIKDGISVIKGTLAPAVAVYISKGKVGIVEGLKEFFDGLTEEVRTKLIGVWQENKLVEKGVLEEDQVRHLVGILEGQVDPRTIADFVGALQPHQLQAAAGILTFTQIQTLQALAKAASDVQSRDEEKAAS